MSELDLISEYFNNLKEKVTFQTPFAIQEYVNPKLDFTIDPDHFLTWLSGVDEEFDENESYSFNVSKMCEFSCLYIATVLNGEKLNGDLRIVYGHFGWWEHYWVKYTLNGEIYYIDLTLQQFVSDAPKLAITLAKEEPTGYNTNSEGETIQEYIDRKL